MLVFLPFLLLVLPIVEIAVFIMVGGAIGVLPTILMVILTTVMGAALLRIQGFATLRRLRAELEAGRVPAATLGHGVLILVAGLLLITPGLVTDMLGLLLFIPPVRSAVWHLIARRIVIVAAAQRRGGGGGGTIDLDEEEWREAEPRRHERPGTLPPRDINRRSI